MFRPRSAVIEINEVKVPIDPDFRIMCEYSEAVLKKDSKCLAELAGRFFFTKALPDGVSEADAKAAMEDFYSDGLAPGRDRKKEKKISGKTPMPSFDFEEDEAYFYADFLAHYSIDLNRARLHWFDFCALFRRLPDECRLKRIISIRSQELSEIKSSAEKARVKKLKGVFALKVSPRRRFDTAAERSKAMRSELLRQAEEAKKAMRGVRK